MLFDRLNERIERGTILTDEITKALRVGKLEDSELEVY